MASPQWEEGHAKIANELLEAYAKFSLTGGEFRVLFVVLREIYGWSGGKKSKDDIWRKIPWTTFIEKTGLNKSNISRALKNLRNFNFIERRECETGGWEYRPQKDWEKIQI